MLAQEVADVIANARYRLTPNCLSRMRLILRTSRDLQSTLTAHLAYIGEADPLTNVFQSYATRWQYIRQAFERNWTATSADAVSYLIRLPSLQPEIAEWEHNADELAIERRHQALPVPKEEDEEEL